MAGNGSGKGPGNGRPKAPPFKGETPQAAEGRKKAGFVQRKMAEYRRLHPDAPPSMRDQERIIREALRASAEKRADVLIEVSLDKKHKDFGKIAPLLWEHDMGKPKPYADPDGGGEDNRIIIEGGLPDENQ